MATTTKPTNRATVALNLPRAAPALLVYASGVMKRMDGNPAFATPTPPLNELAAAISDLQAAETAALARTKGAAVARDEKRKSLVAILQEVRTYVQKVADADATNAASIIESAGVAVRKVATRRARAFTAQHGEISGVAKVLAASAGHRSAYDWQYSADGGKTWVTAPSTLQAKTTVSGLTPGATVQFRYRAVTKAGEGDWSQPVSLLIQ